MIWIWLGLGLLAIALGVLLFHWHILRKFLPVIVRIFQEKPLFIIPRGQPLRDAEDLRFPTADGLTLCGCYLHATGPRHGVILFGLEFGSNRWSCVPYCEFLRENGFDVFAFESRNQGDSDAQLGYEPLQWVTDYEVRDFQGALAYLKGRPDADPRGVGLFGLSKGGSAGLIAAADDDYVRCCVTDGIFAAHTTMVPYMQKWIRIYSDRIAVQYVCPRWYFGYVANLGLRQIERTRGCRFPHLEDMIGRLGRPLFMIHGGADNYIKPEMAQALFDRARGAKQFWLVDGAKHNQAFHVANGDYQKRVLAFFLEHLGRGEWHKAESLPPPHTRSVVAASDPSHSK